MSNHKTATVGYDHVTFLRRMAETRLGDLGYCDAVDGRFIEGCADELEALRAENARLRKALGNCWCPQCRGASTLLATSHRGDPRDDNGSSVWRCCPTCGGSGLHPAAAEALKEGHDEKV